MTKFLLIALVLSLTSSSAIAIGQKKAKNVPYRTELQGAGEAASGTIIRIGGKLIALRGLKDLNEMWSACRSTRGNLVGVSKFAQDGYGPKTCKGTDAWDRDYRCGMDLTAVEQRDGLQDIIAGKSLRCELPEDAQMRPFWSQRSHITRGGGRVYSGECYIGEKSVSTLMLAAGLTVFDDNEWLRIKDPTAGEKYGIYIGFKLGKSVPKGPAHLRTGCGWVKTHLRKDEWFFDSPR